MNVQELIVRLMLIKDKSKEVIDSDSQVINNVVEWSDEDYVMICGDDKFDDEDYVMICDDDKFDDDNYDE